MASSSPLLLAKLVTSVSDIGDLLTDSVECRASVAAAQNLIMLAKLLSKDNSIVCGGLLFVDDSALIGVDVRLDGTLVFEPPKELIRQGRKWSLSLPSMNHVKVIWHPGEYYGDDTWVVDDPAFYTDLLNTPADQLTT